jgi:prepilin-type N-terminal cleavage/methylation domain-containing protein/prepilin-type processing-associated H-X9-DG protein
MKNTQNINKKAFTLIELLVVIAIIAILAAILFPVFAQAREKARSTACLSNLRQVGLGIRMYCDDYDGVMPESSHTGVVEERCWIYQLKPYTGKSDEIRFCPSDPRKDERKPEGGTSYLLNDYLVVPDNMAAGMLSLDSIPRPADMLMTFEIAQSRGTSYTEDHTHARNWFRRPTGSWQRILADISPDQHGGGKRGLTNRTNGTSNYLYCDGHVKTIPAQKIKGWADTNFNFAEPQP